jgi:hypothetical protein
VIIKKVRAKALLGFGFSGSGLKAGVIKERGMEIR